MLDDFITQEYCNFFDEQPQNFFMKLEHCGRYLYALDHISPDDIVADISCATGYGSSLLAEKAKYVIGADINDSYIHVARKNYQKNNLDFLPINLPDSLSLRRNDISAIVCFETIEHTEKPFDVIEKFYDILPKGGKLFLSFPNEKSELVDEKGKSLDRFHLSIINYHEMLDFVKEKGFIVNNVLGQSLINKVIAQLIEIEEDLNLSFDKFYNYAKSNILFQSRLLAYPNGEDIDKSYSFILDLEKR